MSGKYYAVRKGYKIGIFRSWAETEPLVKGFKGAKYKSFKTLAEAQAYLNQTSNSEAPSPSQPRNQITYSNIAEPVPPHSDNPDEITVYTDGSCVDKKGGFGVVMLSTGTMTPLKGKVPQYPTTNQVAELYAIYVTLYNLTNTTKNIVIYTDSKYSIGCLTQWNGNWRRNGWINSKGEPVANKELIQAILKLMTKDNITFHHVKAHNGDYYNEMADRLANEGRMM